MVPCSTISRFLVCFCFASVLGGLILFGTAIHCMRKMQAEELEALNKAKAEAAAHQKKGAVDAEG